MFAVIYVPHFSLQAALRLDPRLQAQPLVLIDSALPKIPVVELTAAARAAGVTEGLTATQARARCADVIIKTRSPAMESAAHEALLQSAYDFSPDIEATSPGVVTLSLNGFANLDYPAYARKMVAQIACLHLTAQVGVAHNPLLALHAARHAQPVLVLTEADAVAAKPIDVESPTSFLRTLPVAALEPSPETAGILKQWGIHTLGEFIALGEEAITDRLGVEGRWLFDRATARRSRPLQLVRPAERYEEGIEFEHEIETSEPLLFCLRRFTGQIVVRMGLQGQVAENLTLRLKFSNGPAYEHVFKVPDPTGNDELLFRMLHTHLENFTSANPIIGVQLSGRPCIGRTRQFGLFESSLRDPNHFAETLARLSALPGVDDLGTPNIKPTHRPDTFEMKPVEFEARRETSIKPPQVETAAPPQTGLPLRRFRPPVPVQMELMDGRPVRFRATNISGAVQAARGPLRSSGDWWDQQEWSRDEWDVETVDGSLYRLFEHDGDWFLEGIYD